MVCYLSSQIATLSKLRGQGVRNSFKWLSLWCWYVVKLGSNEEVDRIQGARPLMFTFASSAAAESKH